MESWTLTWTVLKPFTEESINNLANNLPGVYRFSYLDNDGNYYIFYVGKAEDVKSRLLEHLPANEQNACILSYLQTRQCFFRFAKITQPHVREAAERLMYKRYEPSCNEVEPSGREDIEINLT